MAMSGMMSVSTGTLVDIFNLRAEDVKLDDIATALSNLCRFGGHTKRFYSVAQHSVRVARALPPELRLEGLLHDAAETYMVDLPRPLKMAMPAYQEIERRVHEVIAFRFGLPIKITREVKEADEAALLSEFQQLMVYKPPEAWFAGVTPLPPVTEFYGPEEAKGHFLCAFADAAAHRLMAASIHEAAGPWEH